MTQEQQKTLKTARERIKSRMMLFEENGVGLSPLERSAIELAHIVENHAAKIESMQKQLNVIKENEK